MALRGTIPVDRVRLSNSDRNKVRNYTFPSDIGPHGLLMVFNNYKFETSRDILRGKEPSVSISNTILLPLPTNLQESLSPRLNSFDQSSVISEPLTIAAAEGKAAGSQGMASAITNAMRDLLPEGDNVASALRDAFANNDPSNLLESLGKQSNYLLRKQMEQFGLARSFDAGFGTTVNPKTTLGFEGVMFKKHNFQWNLAPRDRAESELIKDITNTIKRNSLPTYEDLKLDNEIAVSRALLTYPSTVDMFLIGLDADYFFYFKTAMIDQVSTNYTPQGLSILKGGRPSAVSLTLDFTETDIHTAEDYDGLTGRNSIKFN